MASTLDSILDLVKNKVAERGVQRGGFFRQGSLLDRLSGMISQRVRQNTSNPRPASEDPYGDPAGNKVPHNARPASEDPYGDPADQKR